jgi:hypothetical protein
MGKSLEDAVSKSAIMLLQVTDDEHARGARVRVPNVALLDHARTVDDDVALDIESIQPRKSGFRIRAVGQP